MAAEITRRRSRKSSAESGDALALGLLAAGALGVVAGAIAATTRKSEKIIVGGVDLSNVDPTKPFFVDFSVGPEADVNEKIKARYRLLFAWKELMKAFPQWLLRPQVNLRLGRFILLVNPVASPELMVAKTLLEP